MPTGFEEAAVVYGVVVGTIELIKTAREIYDAVQDKSGIPDKLKKVAEQLPSVESLLQGAQEQYDKSQANKDVWTQAKPDVEQCQKHCKALKDLLDKALPKEGSNTAERTWKATKNVLGSTSKDAQKHLKAICDALSKLQQRQIITNTALLEDIKVIVGELAGDGIYKYHHEGIGDVNVAESGGHFNQQSGANSKMFNGPISGLTFNEALQPTHTTRQQKSTVTDVVRSDVSYTGYAVPEVSEYQFVESLLDWLHFDNIHDRRQSVSKAHAETFHWVFSDQSRHGTPNPGLREWLQHGHGIYWITGKAGSGKSTLMKYITDEPLLEEDLRTWSGSQRLLIGSYYFWSAGSHEQKSLEGLYRTLLWQLLGVDRKLARLAFPTWRPVHSTQAPKLPMLREAMSKVLGGGPLSNTYCFLIDGLDEYELNDSISKMQLAKDMVSLTASREVKIIVGSRPETPFETSFRPYRSLAMEDFTRLDILAYVTEEMSHIGQLPLLSEGLSTEIDLLAQDIVRNAQGVFLWVKIVVNILQDAIASGDDISTLRSQLKRLAPELEKLYVQILRERIPQRYREEAYRYLAILVHWRSVTASPLLASQMAVAQAAGNDGEANTLAAEDYSVVRQRGVLLPRRLRACCLGLLECGEVPRSELDKAPIGRNKVMTPGVWTVSFLHRSVFEFLASEEVRATIQSGLGKRFDVNVAILAGLISSLAPKSVISVVDIFDFNRLAELSTKCAQTTLIDCLDRKMCDMASNATEQTGGQIGLVELDLAGPMNVSRNSGHWTDLLQEDYHRPCEWNTDLLAFTIRTGSALYLRERIKAHGSIPGKQGRPLLDYAVFPEIGYSPYVYGTNFRAAKLLLEYGADPNKKFNQWSPWQNALYFLARRQGFAPFSIVARRPGNTNEISHEGSSWLETAYCIEILDTFALLLDYKADPNAYCVCKGTQYSAYDVVQGFVLGEVCCELSKMKLEDCTCEIAQVLRPKAENIMKRLSASPTVKGLSKLRKLRRLVRRF
ncbi:hypothetical protein LTS10_003560 [Elasticomyces elasticus]|nr:hypothetical protein LTS10_003560 [Elasticomyces elasticus]